MCSLGFLIGMFLGLGFIFLVGRVLCVWTVDVCGRLYLRGGERRGKLRVSVLDVGLFFLSQVWIGAGLSFMKRWARGFLSGLTSSFWSSAIC